MNTGSRVAEQALRCPKCASRLRVGDDDVVCQACSASWPVRAGIPRFVEAIPYWGELSREQALTLIQAAEQQGWRQAIESISVSGLEAMRISVCDWQRASWIPLLGLGGDSVVLDVGSGYGVITQALALSAGHVFSVEAITERIEFTKVRIQQQGITNVTLLQASALELPFGEASFDLIVVNGVLEWVGEWEKEGDPRSVQRNWLARLQRLLKEDGLLLVGIENRVGYAVLRGGVDHSGLPYTSLMPRWLASFVLRQTHRTHHRTALNPRREYRTYTYSAHGYRKLLRESGFSRTSFYWAYPGYNQPYYLIPLRRALVHKQFRAHLRYAPQASPKKLRRGLLRLLARIGFPPAIVSDYLILSDKGQGPESSMNARLWSAMRKSLPFLPELQNPSFELATRSFGQKSIIRVYESREVRPTLFLKTSMPVAGAGQDVLSEFTNLELVYRRLASAQSAKFSVARPIGYGRLGACTITAEGAVPGRELYEIVLPEGLASARLRELDKHIPICTEIAGEFARLLHGETSVPAAASAWWDLPPELNSHPQVRSLWAEASGGTAGKDPHSGYDQWVQHGDFTIENIFFNSAGSRYSLVDLEHLIRGVPPLYDAFSFLCSLLPAVRTDTPGTQPVSQLRDAQFIALFFQTGRWADLARNLVAAVSKELKISADNVWPMFIQFLVTRYWFYFERQSQDRNHLLRYLLLASQHRKKFLGGSSPRQA